MASKFKAKKSKTTRKRTDHREPPRQNNSRFYPITGMFKGDGNVIAFGTPKAEFLDGLSAKIQEAKDKGVSLTFMLFGEGPIGTMGSLSCVVQNKKWRSDDSGI